jgi:hypothetical protein
VSADEFQSRDDVREFGDLRRRDLLEIEVSDQANRRIRRQPVNMGAGMLQLT